ncbi:MAG: hypothetical protein WDO74_28115 [Pseudomonadota bacterium]
MTVQNTGATAVDVLAGTLTLLAGTTIQMAGTSQAHRAGITVEGTGKLVAKIASGRVSVIKNTAQGIRVIGRGSVDLEGVVTSNTGTIPTTYNGTIVISQNSEADIELNQTGATPPLNTIKGVLATGSVTSDGLLIRGGTAAYVRRSVFVGNGLSGIHLSYTGTKANGNSDMTAVDLGKTADLGLNVVQGANDQLNNKGSGICININPTPVQVVSAQGQPLLCCRLQHHSRCPDQKRWRLRTCRHRTGRSRLGVVEHHEYLESHGGRGEVQQLIPSHRCA